MGLNIDYVKENSFYAGLALFRYLIGIILPKFFEVAWIYKGSFLIDLRSLL